MRRRCIYAWLLYLIIATGSTPTILFLSMPTRPPADMLVWEKIGNPDSMDPAVDNENFGDWVLSNIYETLYTYPFNSSTTEPLVPLLATGQPSISPDGKNYTIELRQHITFHDDTLFNASCVKWNIERAMKIYAEGSTIGLLAGVLKGGSQVRDAALSNGTDSSVFRIAFDNWVANSGAMLVINAYTIRFVLERAYSPFVTLLATRATSVMSPKYAIEHAETLDLATWETYGVDYGDHETFMDTHTCGTGPYILDEWVVDQFIHLTKFEDYWRTRLTTSEIAPPSDAGEIREVYIRTNDDMFGRMLNLRTGLVDGCDWPATRTQEIWNPDEENSTDSNIRVSTGGYEFAITFFGFNMGNLTVNVDSSTVVSQSPFRNKHFRLSTSFAFNYSNFIEEEYYGFGVQGKGPIPIGMAGHNGSSFALNYDIETAVEEWNLAMQDAEFVSLLNAINCSLTFYYIESSSLRSLAMDLLQQGLEDVYWHPAANHTGLNFNMTFKAEGVAFPVYLQYITEGRLPIIGFGWVPDYADPISYLYPLCFSRGELAQQISYNNTDIDLQIDLAISETNSSVRQLHLDQIQDTVSDDVPYIWAVQQLEFRTWRNWIFGEGLTFNPMRGIYIYHVVKIYPTETPSPYFFLGSYFTGGLFVALLAYFGIHHFTSDSVLRRRVKFSLLVIYAGLVFGIIVWSLFLLFFYMPFSLIPVLLWPPWCFLYSDYMSERDALTGE